MFKMKFLFFLLLFLTSFSSIGQGSDNKTFEAVLPSVILSDTEIKIYLYDLDEAIQTIELNGVEQAIYQEADERYLLYNVSADDQSIMLQSEGSISTHSINPIPLWMSIIPPLIAIFLALLYVR